MGGAVVCRAVVVVVLAVVWGLVGVDARAVPTPAPHDTDLPETAGPDLLRLPPVVAPVSRALLSSTS